MSIRAGSPFDGYASASIEPYISDELSVGNMDIDTRIEPTSKLLLPAVSTAGPPIQGILEIINMWVAECIITWKKGRLETTVLGDRVRRQTIDRAAVDEKIKNAYRRCLESPEFLSVKVEIIAYRSFSLLVVGRREGSDLGDFNTWGSEALVCHSGRSGPFRADRLDLDEAINMDQSIEFVVSNTTL